MDRAKQGVEVLSDNDGRERLVRVKLDEHVIDPESDLAVQVPEQDSDVANRGIDIVQALREPTPGELGAQAEERRLQDEAAQAQADQEKADAEAKEKAEKDQE